MYRGESTGESIGELIPSGIRILLGFDEARLRETEPEVLEGAVDATVDAESMETVDEAEEFVLDHCWSIVGISAAT